jgi:hypothetical protein
LAAILGLDENSLLGKAGFEPASAESRTSLESELASLRTVEVHIERQTGRHLGLEGAVATAPRPAEPWAEPDERPPFDLRGWIETRIKTARTKAAQLKADLRARNRPEPRSRPAAKVTSPSELAPSQPPPVRLDPRLGPLVAKSYIEDEAERDFYRRRTVGTLLVLVFLFITLWWALRNAGGAIGEFVGGFIDELKIQ